MSQVIGGNPTVIVVVGLEEAIVESTRLENSKNVSGDHSSRAKLTANMRTADSGAGCHFPIGTIRIFPMNCTNPEQALSFVSFWKPIE